MHFQGNCQGFGHVLVLKTTVSNFENEKEDKTVVKNLSGFEIDIFL